MILTLGIIILYLCMARIFVEEGFSVRTSLLWGVILILTWYVVITRSDRAMKFMEKLLK